MLRIVSSVLFVAIAVTPIFAPYARAAAPVKVTASGYQKPHHPQNSIDDDEHSRWSCKGTCWIKYDFGEVRYTKVILIAWLRGEERTQKLKLETSLNGSRWHTVFNGETEIPKETGAGPWYDTYDIDDDIRYVRITGYGNSVNNWNSLLNISFDHRLPGTPEGRGFNPDVVGITSSNVISDNTPDRAMDFNIETFWTGGTDDYVQFEFDDVYPLISIDIAWMNGHTRIQKYAIDFSLDGDDWERATEASSSGATLRFENHLFLDLPLAKYVRIVNNGGNNSKIASSKPKISITEVEFVAVTLFDEELAGIRLDDELATAGR